jgi:hypothetical protein
MKLQSKLIIVLITSSLLSLQTTQAAAQANCPDRVKACEDIVNQESIALRDGLEVTRKQRDEISALENEISQKDRDLISTEASRDSWYHDPLIVGPIAMILGAVAYSLSVSH